MDVLRSRVPVDPSIALYTSERQSLESPQRSGTTAAGSRYSSMRVIAPSFTETITQAGIRTSSRKRSLFLRLSDLVHLTVTVRSRNAEQLIVRASAQSALQPVEDLDAYQKFFAALEQALWSEPGWGAGASCSAPYPLDGEDQGFAWDSILVVFDTMNRNAGAWRYEGPGRSTKLWLHDWRNVNHPTLYADTGCVAASGMSYTPRFGRDLCSSTQVGRIARVNVG